jgi:hypothetical protein
MSVYLVKSCLRVLASADVTIPSSEISHSQPVKKNTSKLILQKFASIFDLGYLRILNVIPSINQKVESELVSDWIIRYIVKNGINVRPQDARIGVQQHFQQPVSGFCDSLHYYDIEMNLFQIFFTTQRVRWLAYWHTWPQGNLCLI